jgi:hypothetical protein
MRRLTVLLTNNSLAYRAGSELYLRDVAIGLLARGHRPVAYSPDLGEAAEDLRRATVPVLDDLDRLAEPPDLIHGQHHVETMTALLRFPGVPAVSFCHGWLPWEETPPRFPRVHRYVAVDHTCRDRLTAEAGIPPERVEVILNFVDLQRFQSRPPLPPRPRRALVFSNAPADHPFLAAVRAACAAAGLELDLLGMIAGRSCATPEEVLPGYDLVLAKARCALEALATGCAVVLCDQVGLGPMVTAAAFDELRDGNFGIRCLREPVRPEGLLRQLARYDPADAAAVCRRTRAVAGREQALDRILAVYRRALEEDARVGPPDPGDEARAAAAYLRSVSPAL